MKNLLFLMYTLCNPHQQQDLKTKNCFSSTQLETFRKTTATNHIFK